MCGGCGIAGFSREFRIKPKYHLCLLFFPHPCKSISIIFFACCVFHKAPLHIHIRHVKALTKRAFCVPSHFLPTGAAFSMSDSLPRVYYRDTAHRKPVSFVAFSVPLPSLSYLPHIDIPHRIIQLFPKVQQPSLHRGAHRTR